MYLPINNFIACKHQGKIFSIIRLSSSATSTLDFRNLQDEDCIEDEPQTPESLDRSTETVVRVKVVPKASKIPRYQFHPPGAPTRGHISSASSGNDGAQLTVVTEAQSTLAEFSTMTTADLPEKSLMPQSSHHSHSHGEENAGKYTYINRKKIM